MFFLYQYLIADIVIDIKNFIPTALYLYTILRYDINMNYIFYNNSDTFPFSKYRIFLLNHSVYAI